VRRKFFFRNPNVIQGFFMPGKEVDLKYIMDVELPGKSLTTARWK
jgi:hypothetical protein